MRNLKRVLSLALASIMLIGMMAVSASAVDFTDADEIENTTAVNMLVALGIINGMDDGSFDPSGTVTRAQMAKMIYLARNGGKDTTLTGTSLFTDVPDTHWAVGYIEWCANLGIISGDGDGSFRPEDTVTGIEAAKMVLIAIGYDASKSNFVDDDNWSRNIAAQADYKAIFEDIYMSTSSALTRDNAAQMIYNGLNAVLVYYESSLTTVNGEITTVYDVYDNEDGDTLLDTKFSLENETAVLTSISYDADDEEYTYTLDFDDTDGVLSDETDVTVTSTVDYSDLFAMKVEVLFTVTSKNAIDDLYGIYADSTIMVEGVIGDIDEIADVNGTAYDYFTLDDVEYELEYADAADMPAHPFNDYGTIKVGDVEDTDYAYSFRLIDWDDDDEGDVVVFYPVTFTEVTFLSSSKITLADGCLTSTGAVAYDDVDDVTFVGDVEEDDYVAVTKEANTIDGIAVIEKLDVVTAEPTSSKDSSTKFKIDGDWYTLLDTTNDAVALGDEHEFVFYNGFIIMVDASSSTSTDLLILTKVGDSENWSGNYDANVLFSDGTSETVELDEGLLSDSEGTYAYGVLYTYDIDDGVYELEVATTTNTGYDSAIAGGQYDTSTSKMADGTHISDDAVVFVMYDHSTNNNYNSAPSDLADLNSAEVISGADLKDWKEVNSANDYVVGGNAKTTGFTDTVDGFTTVQVLFLAFNASDLPGESGDDTYGYVVSDVEVAKNSDDDYEATFDIWTGDETVSVYAVYSTSDKATAAVSKGDVIFYDDLGDGEIEIDTDVTFEAGAITAWNGSDIEILLAYSSEAKYSAVNEIDEDTIIIYIDTDAVEGVEGASIRMATESAEDVYDTNVIVIKGESDEATVIFVDVNNQILDSDGEIITVSTTE